MKKIIKLFISFIFLSNSFIFGQNVSKDFLDGEVYVIIKKEMLFAFDTLHRNVDIKSKLPFLIPLISKYNITKAEASFYFSKSDVLKRTFRIHFSKNELINKLIAELKNINQIEYIEKIPVMRSTYTPNDLGANNSSASGQYALYNIHAQEAWNVTRGNMLITVAIVDNAIDINHPDLSANVHHQWDVSDDDADPTPPNLNPASKWAHGTHTSGIACATSDNGIGIASIGYYCGLMAVKVTGDDSDPDFMDDGYEGIDWAVSNGAEVISCSWGGYKYSLIGQNTINNAYDNNVIVVAAAGNDNISSEFYPAAYNHVVAVAAVDISDIKAGFSNFGSWVDVSAPGVSIRSTLPNNNYGQGDGTSMAAPMVAGLCGLIRYLNPGLSCDQVVSDLVNTTDNIDAQNPTYILQLGSGRINAYRAVESALICNPPIHLGTGVYTTLKTESWSTITSANTIPAGKQVTFDAAVKVDLVAGFIAANGSVFRAYIDGCGNSFSLNYNSKKQRIGSDETAINKKEINTPQNSLAVNTINVFPNPANGKVSIRYQLGKAANVALHLYNAKGIAVYQTIAGKKLTGIHDISIDVSGFAAGLYLMELKTDDDVKMTKLIIIH